MAYWVYILQSQSTGRHYCGQTDDIQKRLIQHNDPENTFTRTTSRFKGPWRLIHKIECPNRTDAIRLERQIKKEEFVDISRITLAVNPAGGGIVACHAKA